ncbi:intradiol ring-cleavage dioxygenase [Novosphingobium sp. 1949]|uniref:Intradiol ring-cleavage dioxygenase n=1 Tax=Novosphingobium organovorum TaxID=2930092 RepID=A0ABT0BFB3_9SPHN|nr:intradiol ring-cleavage dioxygenase [Novosphingobium organovorum]MCJ2183762.1 intradiol ring-cleavage dioxygenase [Novosphingobium organovorum]
MATQCVGRRRALVFLTGAGSTVALAACGGGDGSSSATSTTSTSTSSTSTSSTSDSSTSSTSDSSTSSSSSDSCIADPTETNGPYPADGTNSSSGSTSNVLTISGVVRSDIRSSFIGSTTTADGIELELTLQLVDVNTGCAAIEGAAIYVWHCNADGKYSLYSSGITTESYLRGVQVTDSEGKVTFTTIYPACYSGRWPHIHFEVFLDGLTSASTGKTADLISQLAMPAATNTEVYSNDSRYTASIANYNAISLSSDNVFGDDTTAEIAQMTPTISGNYSSSYTGSAVIGIAV